VKPALDEEWQAAAVIEVGVGERDVVDAGSIEAERLGVLLHELTPALVEAAVDQDAPPSTFDQVAGTRDLTVGTVEGEVQADLLAAPS